MWSYTDPSIDSSHRLIVGLGNPGPQYYGTRHNAGFLLVDELVERWSASPMEAERTFQIWRCQRDEKQIYLMKPQTFMNLSGLALATFLSQIPLTPQQIMIAYDDVALETGHLRLRPQGSSGGQKGLKHIIEMLGTSQIPRLRLGVGLKSPEVAMSDFVLSDFDENQLNAFGDACRRGADAVEDWLKDSMQTVMSRYNAKVQIKNHSQEEKTTPVEGGE